MSEYFNAHETKNTYFTTGRVEGEDKLLEFEGGCTFVGLCMKPSRFANGHPLPMAEEGMCRTEGWGRIWCIGGGEEGGVFDGVEDVEIGKGADDAEEDDCFYGCIGCMKSEGLEKDAHDCCPVQDPARVREQPVVPFTQTFLFHTTIPIRKHGPRPLSCNPLSHLGSFFLPRPYSVPYSTCPVLPTAAPPPSLFPIFPTVVPTPKSLEPRPRPVSDSIARTHTFTRLRLSLWVQ